MSERMPARPYDLADVRAVYRYLNPSDWDSLIDLLRREEASPSMARPLDAEEVRALREDCERLAGRGVFFPATPEGLWSIVQET